ncbi:MAG TPA: SpoIIE family protein phosphatase [Amycolatopsis sp.]|uniref:SpoIIE family protein phosphatase n=1 Tax=Amycolatopsis sp. TaxID=37632 RepID=UPI002B47AEEB|nr:SpoIIE family protein phosphatase [Amycolatopsis sp.]HKS44068.1 SpoIIE family protein phosphatase [Amycolatopsis sp.]
MTTDQPGTTDATIARLAAVVERQQREIETLRAGDARRRLVHLAEGMLIEQLRCLPTEAAEHLRRLAERAGVSSAELAADLVGQPEAVAGTAGRDQRVRLSVVDAAAQVARDGSELASALLGEALGTAGAVAVALWQLVGDGALELAGHAGFDVLEASRWQRIPPQMDALPQRVVRTARPLWLASTVGVPVPIFGSWPGGARALIPLSGAKSLVGVLEVVWPDERAEIPQRLRRELTTLAGVCARAVDFRLALGEPMRPDKTEAALISSGLLARPVRDEAGEVADFEITHAGEHLEDPAGRPPRQIVGRGLTQAFPWLGASEAFEKAVEVFETGAPCRLDRVPCTALSHDAVTPAVTSVRIIRFFDGVLIDWRLDYDAERLAALLQTMQRLGRIGGWEYSLVTGETSWTGETFALFGLPASARPAGPLELRDHVHPGDVAAVSVFQDMLRRRDDAVATFRLIRPDGTLRQVRAHGEPVVSEAGELTALRGIYQDISAQYQSQVALAATQDRLADTEEEVRQQHRIARQLQEAILPPSLRPSVTGLEVAVRYRPAEHEHEVGGDWYDAVMLADGRVLLVIGDVAGHGIEAATDMVALRNMLRGLSITGAGPGKLLGWLNATACQLARGTTGTVVCGLYEPDRRELRWARAGHLPPLLIRGDTAEFLPLPKGVLLGAVPDAEFREATIELCPGDTLVFYTDGLIERRSVLIDDSLARLARSATSLAGDIEQVADELLHHTSVDTDDDTCLIVIRPSQAAP